MNRFLIGLLAVGLLAGCGSYQPAGIATSQATQAVVAQGVKKLASFDERPYQQAPSLDFLADVDRQWNESDRTHIGEKYRMTCFMLSRDNPLVPFDTWVVTLFNPNKDTDYASPSDLAKKFLTRKAAEAYFEKLGVSYMGQNGQRYLVTVFVTVQDRGQDKNKPGVVVDAIKHPDGTFIKP